jgi:uncharacterized membrane protein
MKFLALFFSLLPIAATAASGLNDEMITCSFTEPFLTVKVQSDLVEQIIPGSRQVFLVSNRADNSLGDIDLVYTGLDAQGAVTHNLKLKLDNAGTDGVSDYVYPYSAVLDGSYLGGCSTKSKWKFERSDAGDQN